MEIHQLKSKGVRISFIAKILHAEGLALSTAYYHLSDNRQAYDNNAKKARQLQKEHIKEKIAKLIHSYDMTTGDIARDWNVPLAVLNKIYTS